MNISIGDIVLDFQGRMYRVSSIEGDIIRCIPFVREAFRLTGAQVTGEDRTSKLKRADISGVIKCATINE